VPEESVVPDPQFRETGDDFGVIFSHSTVNKLLEQTEILNERQRGVIEYLETHQEISSSDYGVNGGAKICTYGGMKVYS